MTAIPLILDGYLGELPVPGDDGLTARFQAISSPTDDTVFACCASAATSPCPAPPMRAAPAWTWTPWNSWPRTRPAPH
ncbi:hypothetical protein [Streptomyces omiyaensis]|uniref:hypothetical protein n=1 Tax=Streptomyces omiyaensis TaxID=68247 RepID=UPI003702C1C9